VNTLARERDTDEIVRRVRTLRPDSVRRWGRMSVHQMVCHLNDAFRMSTGEKAVASIATLRDRTVIKWIALHVPVRWPPGIVTVPEVDQEIGGTKPNEFSADLAELELRVRQFAVRRGDWPPHPIFGKLSEAEWLRWGYLHTDHHLRQFGA
jgi:uncharacterized protein DUF1569